MLSPPRFLETLNQNGIRFFAGVPDSLLKDLCACISDRSSPKDHLIAANEGAAVALAAGHHLATGGIPAVYLQNSGIGNTVNPLLSLVDPEVYSMPVLLIIGWRGEPGDKDEPQHVKQGKVTTQMLDAMGIPWQVLSTDERKAAAQVAAAVDTMKSRRGPFAWMVRKGTFEKYEFSGAASSSERAAGLELTREAAIQCVIRVIPNEAIVVSTTGMTSRELFECRAGQGSGHSRDFLTVGSMGHASQIALGIAMEKPGKEVYCIDGDGAVLMHMGALTTIGQVRPANYRHVVINNGAHDSVGGQPTVGLDVDLPAIAKAAGYQRILSVRTEAELVIALKEASGAQLSFIEVRVRKGSRKDLGRPTTTPIESKNAFMAFVSGP